MSRGRRGGWNLPFQGRRECHEQEFRAEAVTPASPYWLLEIQQHPSGCRWGGTGTLGPVSDDKPVSGDRSLLCVPD